MFGLDTGRISMYGKPLQSLVSETNYATKKIVTRNVSGYNQRPAAEHILWQLKESWSRKSGIHVSEMTVYRRRCVKIVFFLIFSLLHSSLTTD
jgi:hypothetical protein